MKKFYSNGKLLLTGEYLVLDGAKALAVPTVFGQDLVLNPIKEPVLFWQSFDVQNQCWFEAEFELKKLRLKSCTYASDTEGAGEQIAETLLNFLKTAKTLNPSFLETKQGFRITTKLSFDRDWGLGSSSTLLNNIANWAKVNPYDLLWNAFKGSGYDIACAGNDFPIIYQLKNDKPIITPVTYAPLFKEQLYFVHLNQKQNSRDGIAKYKKNGSITNAIIEEISSLTTSFYNAATITELEKVIFEHEKIIGSIINTKPVQESIFSNYPGAVKSLGAWGGDFVLATGNEDAPKYFKKKGFETVLSFQEMVFVCP